MVGIVLVRNAFKTPWLFFLHSLLFHRLPPHLRRATMDLDYPQRERLDRYLLHGLSKAGRDPIAVMLLRSALKKRGR